ncbi:Programmed cell death protein 2, C-terminal putative domain containing protein [Novymonas esmeraldas]|uniref:Programmed cell death protein 2, C-terminal putative domain containing protein n=1 Tax=Novymonas esmeraldas TaxID=1808958 RepID=A0AAW0EN42_9TRYP
MATPSSVLLGLFDGYMPHHRDQLSSETKLGGTPTYFPTLCDTDAARIRAWTSCGVCGRAMSLLAQAYSPLPTAPTSRPHHRMVYVFACNSGYCARQPSSSTAAFSVQVDEEDTQALAEEEDEEDGVMETSPPLELPEAVLPPCFVAIDAEPDREVVVPTDVERELIKMAEENAHSTVMDEELQQLEMQVDLKNKKTDYHYERFRSRVARAPTQVLRYYERTVATAVAAAAQAKAVKPIFMNPDKVRAMFTVSACACCGAAQTAELQVMPTCLYYLQVSRYTALARGAAAAAAGSSAAGNGAAPRHTSSTGNVDDGCDFGTMTVYVCSKDCAARLPGVVVRRETLCVEEAPTMRDEELAETTGAASANGGSASGKLTLRELLHGAEGVDGDEDDEEEDEDDDVPAAAAAAKAA